MNVHIRSRPFKCRLAGCDADFNELSNRNAHEKGVHKFNFKDLADSAAASATTTFVIDPASTSDVSISVEETMDQSEVVKVKQQDLQAVIL